MDNLYVLMREFLKKRGINAQQEGAGSMRFSLNGLNFLCYTNDSDPFFLRLTLPRINKVDAPIDRLNDEIQQLNYNYKVARIVKGNDGNLMILADLFVYSTENADLVFDRLIQAMTQMIGDYYSLERDKGNGTIQAQ